MGARAVDRIFITDSEFSFYDWFYSMILSSDAVYCQLYGSQLYVFSTQKHVVLFHQMKQLTVRNQSLKGNICFCKKTYGDLKSGCEFDIEYENEIDFPVLVRRLHIIASQHPTNRMNPGSLYLKPK